MATIQKITRPRTSAMQTGAVPGSMKAAAIDRFGPPQALSLHTLPVVPPGPGEVVIELHAAGVGGWDAAVRDGSWRPEGRPRFPLIPGTDGAGIVVVRGPRVRRFDVGDRVLAYHYANPHGGFYADYATVDIDHVGSMPRRLDFAQAAAAATTGLTALQGIDDALRVGRGDTVLIFGATGAVGTLAIQFAKRHRSRVIATASTSEGAELVRKLGADGAFNARAGDAVDRLRDLAPDGIDAALVLSNGEMLEACLDLVKEDGRVAFPNGVWPEPKKRKTFEMLSYDGEAGQKQFERFDHAVAQARLFVPIASRYPLEQAALAHERLGKEGILGRMVLEIRKTAI